jgi:soluble cytochrome b562
VEVWGYIIAIIGSGGFAALISGIFGLIKDRNIRKSCDQKSIQETREGVQKLLYNDIKRTGKKYLKAGKLSSEDLEDIIDTHRIYHDKLSGNGYLDDLMDKVKKLEVM